VLIYASPYVFLCDLMWFISRKGAKLAKAADFLCLFCVFLRAALSQRLCGLNSRFAFCFSFVSFVVKIASSDLFRNFPSAAR